MIFAGCEKIENQLDAIKPDTKEKNELTENKVEITKEGTISEESIEQNKGFNELDNSQLWLPINDSLNPYPLYSPLRNDSVFDLGKYQPYFYWNKYSSPLWTLDSLKTKP